MPLKNKLPPSHKTRLSSRETRHLSGERLKKLLVLTLVKIFPRSRRVFGRRDFHLTAILAEISPLISAHFWPPRFSSRPRSRRDLATNLGGQKRAEITGEISPRSRREKNLGGQKRAEITGEISPRWKSRRPKTRRDYWRDLAEKKISAAKNAPRLLARSRRDENLGGQKRAEITGEISPRWKSRRPKTRRD